MKEIFEYYGLITKDTPKIDTWEVYDYLEVFDVFSFENVSLKSEEDGSLIPNIKSGTWNSNLLVLPEQQIRFGRTDKGKWLFVEPTKYPEIFPDCICTNGNVSDYFSKEYEAKYQKIKKNIER